jgi:hypothetical protein
LDFYFVFKNELKIMRVEETVILLLFYEGWSCGLLRLYLQLHKEKAAIHDFVGLAKAAVITKHRGLQRFF